MGVYWAIIRSLLVALQVLLIGIDTSIADGSYAGRRFGSRSKDLIKDRARQRRR